MSDDSDGTWLSISDLATQRGTSFQAVSKRVRRLVDRGHLQTRKGPNGTKLVNLAAFHRAIAMTEDGVRAVNGAGDDAATPANPILAREQARKTATEADLRQLDLDQRLGKVVPVDQVRAAVLEAGEVISLKFDQLASRIDDILAVVARDGKAAGQAYLRGIGRECRAALARVAGEKAAAAMEGDT